MATDIGYRDGDDILIADEPAAMAEAVHRLLTDGDLHRRIGKSCRETAIEKYEAIYGRDFVSPGGADSAARFAAMLDLRPGEHVLDAGCGLGGAAFLMAARYGVRVTGVDLSANMIALARERLHAHELANRVRLVHGDCLALAQNPEFDVVFGRDVFLHVADKEALFGVLLRVLVPGGRLLVTDYCASPRPWSADFSDYVMRRGYGLHTVADYASMLSAAGFADVRAEDRTDEFIAIHERELARLMIVEPAPPARDELAAAWRAKIARARAGEQRWGLFTARRSGVAG